MKVYYISNNTNYKGSIRYFSKKKREALGNNKYITKVLLLQPKYLIVQFLF